MRVHIRPQTRRGATTVEAAFVLIIAFMFIFGIIEYGRYLWFFNTAYAAAREGARYAAVRTGDGTTTANVKSRVDQVMGGAQSQLGATYTVNVYNADPATGNSISSTWTDAPFSGAIGVQITGTYKFILPGLMQLSNSNGLSVNIKCIINSEAN
ncbi:MAG: TadE/TadG family type IV pilus assembly protein [Gemmataceae bacterium]